VLDALGCAVGALDGGTIKAFREQIEDFGGSRQCALLGGGRTSP
jgi:2-methylcitrate dehydratase